MTEGAGEYFVMRDADIRVGKFRASAVQPSHIENIRQWRNDQLAVLRQDRPITSEEQSHYFNTLVWPDKAAKEPRNMLLSYHFENRIIGYGGLVHISWRDKRAEVSFLLDPDHTKHGIDYEQAFATWLEMMKLLAFDVLLLSRLTTETYQTRSENISVLDQAGYKREGLLRGHVLIEGSPVDAILHGLNRHRGR